MARSRLQFIGSALKRSLPGVISTIGALVSTVLLCTRTPTTGEQKSGGAAHESIDPQDLEGDVVRLSGPSAVPIPAPTLESPQLRFEEAPPHVPCKIYYPTLGALDPLQRRYYAYWRNEFRAGNALPADLTYRFLYAYECPDNAKSLAELEETWIALVRAYATDDTFVHYVAGWIVDLRFEMERYIADDILALEPSRVTRLDMRLLANSHLRWLDVVSAFVLHPLEAERITSYLEDGKAEVDELVRLARATGPISVAYEPFHGLQNSRRGALLANVRTLRPSYVANPAFRQPLEKLIAGACDVLSITRTHGDADYVVSGQAAESVPIVRTTLTLPVDPDPGTLDGVLASIHHVLGDDARMLLAVVLASSERLPYVEGRIDAVKELREKYESFANACGRTARIGQFRNAFFELGHGKRAMWSLEPAIEKAVDVKMGSTIARFTRGLQHGLSGSLARRVVLDMLVTTLAKRTGTSREGLIRALMTTCGASSSIVPALEKEAAS